MSRIPNDILHDIVEDVNNGMSFRQAEEKYGYPKSTINDAYRNSTGVINVPVARPAPKVVSYPERKIPELGTYDAQKDEFLDWLGQTVENPFAGIVPPKSFGKKKKYVVATDWHVPFHNKKVVAQMVLDAKRDLGICSLIIGGDLMDGYELNSYGRTKNVTLEEEMAATKLMLEWLATQFEEIIIVDDNHMTGRWHKYLSKNVPPSIQKMMAEKECDPYSMISAHLPNVKLARRTYKNGAKIGWFHVVGDALIAHGETHSAVAMKPVHNVLAWFDYTRKRLGIPEIRCYIEAHVHKLGGPYYVPGRDIALFESGCLASEEAVDYGWDASMKYKPIENGVIYLVQDDGRTVHNETRIVRYPFED